MSDLAIGRGKVIGLTAAAAVLLATMSGGAAQAAEHRDSSTGRVAPRALFPGKITTTAADQTHIPSVCTINSYAPNKFVVGAKSVTKTFSVKVDGCTLDIWGVTVFPFVAPNGTGAFAETAKPTISLSPQRLANSYAGKQIGAAWVQAYGLEDPPDTDEVFVDPAEAFLPLTLQRQATIGSFNATPEPVKKGKLISLKATLYRVNWNGAKTLGYVGFAGKTQVQFKADGTSKYVTVKTVTATSKGKISTTVKAGKSGRWRLFYPGISTTAPATSPSDAVKVN